jgi:hypothetical protein
MDPGERMVLSLGDKPKRTSKKFAQVPTSSMDPGERMVLSLGDKPKNSPPPQTIDNTYMALIGCGDDPQSEPQRLTLDGPDHAVFKLSRARTEECDRFFGH